MNIKIDNISSQEEHKELKEIPKFVQIREEIRRISVENPEHLSRVQKEEVIYKLLYDYVVSYDDYYYGRLAEIFYKVGRECIYKISSCQSLMQVARHYLDLFKYENEYIRNFDYELKHVINLGQDGDCIELSVSCIRPMEIEPLKDTFAISILNRYGKIDIRKKVDNHLFDWHEFFYKIEEEILETRTRYDEQNNTNFIQY